MARVIHGDHGPREIYEHAVGRVLVGDSGREYIEIGGTFRTDRGEKRVRNAAALGGHKVVVLERKITISKWDEVEG